MEIQSLEKKEEVVPVVVCVFLDNFSSEKVPNKQHIKSFNKEYDLTVSIDRELQFIRCKSTACSVAFFNIIHIKMRTFEQCFTRFINNITLCDF